MKTKQNKTKGQGKPELLQEYEIESIDQLMWNPYYCDDCDTWHEHYVGLEVNAGEILDVSCDTDGNWEHNGAGEKATEENYDRLNRELLEQTEQANKAYMAHCAETGDDPLGTFYVKRTVKRKEHWQARYSSWIGQAKHGFAVTEVSKGKRVYSAGEMPAHVSEFLGIQKVGDRYCMEGIKSFDDITGADTVKPTVITFTIERDMPRPEAIVKSEIQAIARRNLK